MSAEPRAAPMAVTLARIKAALRDDYERLLRARAARQARQAVAAVG